MQSRNCVQDAPVAWNFQKFLINPDGSWYSTVASAISPTHSSIVSWITSNTSIQNQEESYFNVFLNIDNKLIVSNKNQNKESFSVKIINMTGQELAKHEFTNSINEINLRFKSLKNLLNSCPCFNAKNSSSLIRSTLETMSIGLMLACSIRIKN